jgi:hypothetical protein
VAQLRSSARLFGDEAAMDQTPDEANAKPGIAVKHEESLELLKAFLMIRDPTLRAEIISTVKKTACDQK